MKRSKLLQKLKSSYPDIAFEPAKSYYWSPKDRTVFYQETDTSETGLWTILHESCHGILNHMNYRSDFELLTLEVSAWEKANELSSEHAISIDPDYVQDCLDSYRNWQYKRSLCPRCELGGIQINPLTYTCMFCDGTWQVSKQRFFRPYRTRK